MGNKIIRRISLISFFTLSILLFFLFNIYLRQIDTNYKSLKCTTYGDSITAMGGWQETLKKRINFNIVYNRGIGSTTYTKNDLVAYIDKDGNYISRSNIVNKQPEGSIAIDSYLCSWNRIKTIPKDSNIVLVMGGTNDFGDNVEIGDMSKPYNEDTFKGAVTLTVGRIKEYLGKNTIVVLISPLNGRQNLKGKGEAINSLGLATSDYAKAIEEVATELNIPYIDVFNDTMIREWDNSFFLTDGIHPNKLGRMEIERVITKGLREISNKVK